MNTNPYTINKPPLSQEISSSLCESASRCLCYGDVFMEYGESDQNRLVALMFNNLSNKEYELRLNRTNAGSKSRPDLLCIVNDVSILNSEFKPLG
ncbi:32020_t:CDS:2, partial [Racocetra persica]